MKKILKVTLICITLVTISCKKDDVSNNTPTEQNTPPACALYSGFFNINIKGTNYEMIVDSSTHFTILYNWYNANTSDFIIYAKDQFNKFMSIEAGLPAVLDVGTISFSSDTLYFDFFEIDVDTISAYVSEVTFNITESNLNETDGTYSPVAGSFQGFAHSYPWTNGAPPIDTMAFSGSFCLNLYIIN